MILRQGRDNCKMPPDSNPAQIENAGNDGIADCGLRIAD